MEALPATPYVQLLQLQAHGYSHRFEFTLKFRSQTAPYLCGCTPSFFLQVSGATNMKADSLHNEKAAFVVAHDLLAEKWYDARRWLIFRQSISTTEVTSGKNQPQKDQVVAIDADQCCERSAIIAPGGRSRRVLFIPRSIHTA